MNQFGNFMQGRYGLDPFSFALIIMGGVLTLISSFVNSKILYLIAIIFYGYSLFRMFSRNIEARRKEYKYFMKVWGPIQKKLRDRQMRSMDKTHSYFRCPKCKQHVRVPKGVGKIEITCPKCLNTFIRKSK